MKRIVAFFLVLMLFVPFTCLAASWYCTDCDVQVEGNFCSNCGKKAGNNVTSSGKNNLFISINFEENAFLSRYDVILFVDNTRLGILPHGQDYEGSVSVTEGIHTLRFVSREDQGVSGSTTVNVGQTTKFSCDISAHYDSIDIENVKTSGGSYLLTGKVGEFSIGLKDAYTKKDVLYLVFDFSHTSNEAQAFGWNLSVDCYQDGIACDTAFTFDKTNELTEIKKGATIEVLKTFKLRNNAPVEIEIGELFDFYNTKKLTTIIQIQ